MKKINFTKWALSLVLSCFTILSALAADIYVSSTGDNAGDGTQGNPVLTLGKAYQLINGATGTIFVSGEVNGYTAGSLSDANAICPFNGTNFSLTIQGVAGTSPKITGNKTIRMFRLRSDMVLKLNDLTLSGTPGDTATFEGTCVFMDGGSIEANNVIFENFKNKANGGVISAAKISANVPLIAFRNCVFKNNACAITGLNTGFGSVLRMNDGVSSGKIYFENCAFVNNNARYGTTFFRQATVTTPNLFPVISFINSTFTGNTNANGNSGCVTGYSTNQIFNIVNCTVKDNPTNGAIRITTGTKAGDPAPIVNIYNSILENNGGYDINYNYISPSLTIKNSLILVKRNVSDTVYVKPATYTALGQLLGAFNVATNSFTPLASSLAINYGAKQYLQNLGTVGTTNINYDQLNNARLFTNDKCDAGAIESRVSIAQNTNISSLNLSTTRDITLLPGANLTVDLNTSVHNVTVSPTSKITVNNGVTLTSNTITLESSALGTATLVDNYAIPTITATVQQYLPQGRNWYVASPIETNVANTGNLTSAGAASVSYYSEQFGWQNNYSGNLIAGVGYVAVSANGVGTNNISFNGKLNSGDVSVLLTKKGSSFTGYNLVANPYPSYMNPMSVINANQNLEPTIWYRTRKTVSPYEYKFETVNTASGVGTNNANTGTVTGFIPPMQAFWVRTLVDEQMLTFTNAMRNHAHDVTVGTDIIPTTMLKTKKQQNQSLLRVKISGMNGDDEAILYFNSDASDSYDKYDSKKMFESTSALAPEIFTMAGVEKLVINGQNTVQYETELPLGFIAKQVGDYRISSSEIANFQEGTRVILKDKLNSNTETELGKGVVYNFNSQITTANIDRFSLVFRMPGTTTNLKSDEKLNVQVFVDSQNRIAINAPVNCNYAIYNAVGKKLNEGIISSNNKVDNSNFKAGVYFVTISLKNERQTYKAVIR